MQIIKQLNRKLLGFLRHQELVDLGEFGSLVEQINGSWLVCLDFSDEQFHFIDCCKIAKLLLLVVERQQLVKIFKLFERRIKSDFNRLPWRVLAVIEYTILGLLHKSGCLFLILFRWYYELFEFRNLSSFLNQDVINNCLLKLHFGPFWRVINLAKLCNFCLKLVIMNLVLRVYRIEILRLVHKASKFKPSEFSLNSFNLFVPVVGMQLVSMYGWGKEQLLDHRSA